MFDWKTILRERLVEPVGRSLVRSSSVIAESEGGAAGLTERSPQELLTCLSLAHPLVSECRKALSVSSLPADEVQMARIEVGQLMEGQSDAGWRSLEARIRDDFRCGRTLDIRGWVLSLTECVLYAWAAGFETTGNIASVE